MTIPKNFGISKIGMLRGEEEGRYGNREGAGGNRQRKQAPQEQLSFELNSTKDAVALLQPPSFNVLYVSTPRIGILQTPEFQAVAQLWNETVELVKPVLRFGFPETSLKTKCPHYDDMLYASSSGVLLANDRTRTLMTGFHRGYLNPLQEHQGHSSSSSSSHGSSHGHHSSHPQQQQQVVVEQGSSAAAAAAEQQPGQSVGMFGISTLAFLASRIMGRTKQQQSPLQQPHQEDGGSWASQQPAVQAHHTHQAHHAIPRSRFLVPDLPSGTLVLALNLAAYWAITNQSRRSSMGGTMTG